MNSLITLVSILAPLFIGYFVRPPKMYLVVVDKLLGWLVYVLLTLIGVSLAQVNNLGEQMRLIAQAATVLFLCTISMNLLVLMWFDRRFPWQNQLKSETEKPRISISGSMKQIGCTAVGFVLGKLFSDIWLPPESASTYALMLLIFLVGMQLGGNGITLRQVLINKRGVQAAVLITLSALVGGVIFSLLMPGVKLSQGLALASGFGWYSLSGIMMTNAYGPVWGSVALVNDMAREFFALAFIPLLMQRHPSAAVGIGGATSLDFSLPVIKSSGGLAVIPLAISYGFIMNLIPPFLMVVFSAWHF